MRVGCLLRPARLAVALPAQICPRLAPVVALLRAPVLLLLVEVESILFVVAAKNPYFSTRMQTLNDVDSTGIASTAAAAAAAVNATISSETMSAPTTSAKSFLSRSDLPEAPIDPDGLPLVYDRAAIETYWRRSRTALQSRWAEFLTVSLPLLTRLLTYTLRGTLTDNVGSLAGQARQGAERLGPTYVKLGQMLSSRPDVLPQDALTELAQLQDGVKPFDTPTAMAIVESELGRPFNEVFSAMSEKPVAAASLAQVYKAVLRDSGKEVAVKVQRPDVRATVSKDLYVLRRAATVYQGVMDRFAPQQRTNYVALLDEWAVGFYTELDFENEARNQRTLKSALQKAVVNVYVPSVYDELCTRRLLVTEWVDGVKLSECERDDIATLIGTGQEAFLTQLLQLGMFHADPHPGNLLKLADGRLCLLDFGLVATLQEDDIDRIVNAIIHLANRDYDSLVDDFIALDILPPDCDRATIMPLMDKALSPYVRGGGAKRYEEEVRRIYGISENTMGGFSAMTRDALTVLNDVPFQIPPYFALLARAIVTLEGVALQGNPDYALILSAYPFVARKMLRDDRPQLQRALQDALYGGGGDGDNNEKRLSTRRLVALLNGALGVAERVDGGIFLDLDSVPGDGGKPFIYLLKYLLGTNATSLRAVLHNEVDIAVDLLFRQAIRKMVASVPRLLPFGLGPAPDTVPFPFVIPLRQNDSSTDSSSSSSLSSGVPPLTLTQMRPRMVTLRELRDAVAPALQREDEVYALALTDAVAEVFGPAAKLVVNAEMFVRVDAFRQVMAAFMPGVVGSGISAFGGGSSSSRSGTTSVVDAADVDADLKQLVDALSEDERRVLADEVQRAASRLWSRTIDRIQAM